MTITKERIRELAERVDSMDSEKCKCPCHSGQPCLCLSRTNYPCCSDGTVELPLTIDEKVEAAVRLGMREALVAAALEADRTGCGEWSEFALGCEAAAESIRAIRIEGESE